MKSLEWKTYRTRFLVKAKQLNSNLSFTDHLGRQHCGRKGDYLVESCDGVLSIAPRQIFEDIYVAMGVTLRPDPEQEEKETGIRTASTFETLRIERIKPNLRGQDSQRTATHDRLPRIRKEPQPFRITGARLSLM
ncbi:MAG TPA: hypothetical protein VGS27_33050 [Candidatus Sulfotelmatobacter sp.]|nr:hypothetical protein [Candidatus Sulfotelmatobacter sp.]